MPRVQLAVSGGGSYWLKLPPDVGAAEAYEALRGKVTTPGWQPPHWLETTDGPSVRRDTVERVELIDDGKAAARRSGEQRRKRKSLGGKAAGAAVVSLLGAIGAMPVHGAEALIKHARATPPSPPRTESHPEHERGQELEHEIGRA